MEKNNLKKKKKNDTSPALFEMFNRLLQKEVALNIFCLEDRTFSTILLL